MPPTSPLTVILLCRSLPLHRGGGLESHTLDLAAGLAARGNRVHVVTTADPDDAMRKGRLDGRVRIHFLRGTPPGGYNWRTFRLMAGAALHLSPRQGESIIHAQGFAGFLVPAMRWRGSDDKTARQRFVATIHGTLFSETELHRDYRRRLGLGERAAALWRNKHRLAVWPLWRRMLARADALMVDSTFTQRELEWEIPGEAEKITYIPLGVPKTRFPKTDAAEARHAVGLGHPLLLSVGRLHRMKGLHVAMEALAAHKALEWEWAIVGEGPERDALKEQAWRLGLAERLHFAGRVPSERLTQYYAAADALLFPELSQPAFGLVALEALLQGTPVIANAAGAVPEVVGESGGELIESPDVEAWSETLGRWLTGRRWREFDPETLRREALLRFSYDRMIDETLAVYRNILSE